jgi:hypothetical protein
MFVLAPELTALVFIRADWGPAEHMLCSQGALAIRMVAIGFLFVVIESILLPGLFSIQSMWWPTLWGLAASGVQVLCILGFALADLPKDSTILVAGVAFVYPFSRILKNGILLLVLRKKTGMFPGPSFVVFVGKMLALVLATTVLIFLVHRLWDPVPAAISLDARQVAAKLQPLLGADRAAGLVPMIHLLIYKAKLALQVAVPAAAMLAAYVGMVMAAGYRQDLVELVQSIRRRRQRKPAEEAGNGNGGQDLQSVG